MSKAGIFWLAYLVAMLFALFGIHGAAGHATHHPQFGNFTRDEINWMKRQKAVDNTWCCGDENITLIEDPHFRVRRGHWEVHLIGQWVQVPQGRMFRHNADDPPPFAETFVFFSTNAAGEVTIYCFRTPTGG